MFNNEDRKVEEKGKIEFVLEKNDPYIFYKDKIIRLRISDTSFTGVYRGMTNNGQLVLRPHIRYSSDPKENHTASLDDRPCFISYNSTHAVGPEDEKNISRIIEESNSKFNQHEHPACLI